jgi:hypothetical protein
LGVLVRKVPDSKRKWNFEKQAFDAAPSPAEGKLGVSGLKDLIT